MEKERKIFLESIVNSTENLARPATNSSGDYCAKKDFAGGYSEKSEKNINELMEESEERITGLKSRKKEAWDEITEEIANINPLATAGVMGAYSLSFAGLAGYIGTAGAVYFSSSVKYLGGAVTFCIASAIEGAFFCAAAFNEYKSSGRSRIKFRISEFKKVNAELKKETLRYKSLKREYKQKE